MTAQIPDIFLYQGKEYRFVALDGEGLITPQDYDMNPEMLSTACWRGFYSTYEITDDGLFLTKMVIGKVEEGYKSIQGIMPTLPDEGSHDYPTYKGLRLLTPISGKIRLGKDFIPELYIHMAYQMPIANETLLEFTFEKGKLVSMQDISANNAKKRDNFKKKFEAGKLGKTIQDSFYLDTEIE